MLEVVKQRYFLRRSMLRSLNIAFAHPREYGRLNKQRLVIEYSLVNTATVSSLYCFFYIFYLSHNF